MIQKVGWKDNNIEDYIENYGINEDITDKEVYEYYKSVTDEPFSKTMFTQYLIEHKGYKKVRLTILGKRSFYYKKK